MRALIVGLGLVLSMGSARADRPKVGDDKPLEKSQQAPWDRGVSPESMQAAARAFEEANAQLDASLPSKAVEKYSEALKLWPHPMIHYNLALALIELKRPSEVADHLEKAVEHGVAGLNNQQDKLDQAERFLQLALDQLATIEVTCEKEGAKVSIDGKHVFTVEKGKSNKFRARVPIGKHTFVAEKPGYATPVDAPFIGPRETFRIELKLYTAEELTRWKRRWETKTWAPWAVVAGGAVAGLVAGGLQWSANSSFNEFDSKVARCTADGGGTTCDVNEFSDLRESGDSKRTLGFIGYGIAGAAILTGGLLVYLNREVSYQITTDEYRMELFRKQQKPAKPAVTIAPIVAPGAGGAVLMGRF